MNRFKFCFLYFLIFGAAVFGSRLKDISSVTGIRTNQLIGYGLVIGLNGTGDGKSQFTKSSMTQFMKTMGIKVDSETLEMGNVAAVVVTGTLPPFAKMGQKIDIKVSAIGAATSLMGGTLIMTPLKASDNEIYAVGQGSVSLSSGDGKKIHPTVGEITGGAIVEKDYNPTFINRRTIDFVLNDNDFTTAARVARKINEFLGGQYASTSDSNSISVIIPHNYTGSIVQLLASLENLSVETDSKARIVLNERTGTIVMGERVKISPVAISHGNLSIKIKGKGSDAASTDFVSDRSSTEINKPGDKILLLNEGANVADVVKGLNAIGASSNELIPILQAIKAAGAINADLELL